MSNVREKAILEFFDSEDELTEGIQRATKKILWKTDYVYRTLPGLYLFLTSTALIVIFTIRNRDHFWRAPKLSRPMKISFTILSLVAIALVYMPATKKLFHFSNFSIELFMIVVILTLVYFVIVDTVKVWFYRSTIGQRITEG